MKEIIFIILNVSYTDSEKKNYLLAKKKKKKINK